MKNTPEYRAKLRADLAEAESHAGEAGWDERIENLRKGLDRAMDEWREAMDAAVRVGATEPGFRAPAVFGRVDADDGPFSRIAQHSRDEALRAIERNGDFLSARAGDRLEGLIRSDETGAESRYIAAIAEPVYERAFKRWLSDPAGIKWFPETERDAVRRATEAAHEVRAALTSATSWLAVPFSLDPTVSLISDGVVNPLRQVSRVITIAGNTWKGVNSAGISASYDAEAEEVSEDTPTLTQPETTVLTARAFVPFSIESEDWTGLRAELVAEFQESKDVLESSMFTLGTGTSEPEGLLTAATNMATTAGTAVFAVDDVYSLKEALPARYQPRARFMASGTILDKVRRFTGPGHTTEMPVFDDAGPTILRKPAHENSAMSASTASAEKILVYGDFSRFLIVDRIGMAVELVAHLFGENHRPTGQRGLFAYWRNSSLLRHANAFRTLVVR